LHARGLTSDQDLEAAEAVLNRARASVQTSSAQISLARAGVKTAETNRSKAIVRAPIDGIVLARSVEVGQTVTAGFQTPVLLTIGRDLSGMQLKVDVDEADVGKVKDGQLATFVVDAYPKRRFASKVVRLSNMPKAETTVITYEAELTVDNKDRLLRPGMTATATIVTSEQKDVLSVPNAALRFEPPPADGAKTKSSGPPALPIPGMGGGMRRYGGGSAKSARPSASAGASGERGGRDSVWVVEGQSVKRLAVETGATDGRRTEISGPGVRAGLQVAIDVAETEE
jgi:HlyD family secretion protein